MIEAGLILCLALAFILAGIESALLEVSRVRVRHAAEAGDAAAARLTKLLEDRRPLLHAASCLHHVAMLTGYVLLQFLLLGWLGSWGWLVGIFIVLPLLLLIVELLPRQIFKRSPFRLLRLCNWLLGVLQVLAKPWGPLLKNNTIEPLTEVSSVTEPSGVPSLAKTIGDLNLLPPNACLLLHKVSNFSQSTARSCMTSLKNLSALPPDMPLANALVLTRELKHPWRAVLQDQGALLGWLDALSLPAKPAPDRLVRQFLRPMGQVKAHESALRCLQVMRKRNEPLLAVQDDQGLVIGVLTQEALMKALFNGQ
jgi:putative hemolysin